MMLGATEVTERDECVYVLERSLEQAGAAPELRWTPVMEGAADALSTSAPFSPVAPQHVGGADEPVFVRGVEGCRAARQREQSRAADQRCVVKVDDVEITSGQEGFDVRAMD